MCNDFLNCCSLFRKFDKFGEKLAPTSLTKTHFLPYELYDNQTLEQYVRGLTTQQTQSMDSSFTEEVRGDGFH